MYRKADPESNMLYMYVLGTGVAAEFQNVLPNHVWEFLRPNVWVLDSF